MSRALDSARDSGDILNGGSFIHGTPALGRQAAADPAGGGEGVRAQGLPRRPRLRDRARARRRRRHHLPVLPQQGGHPRLAVRRGDGGAPGRTSASAWRTCRTRRPACWRSRATTCACSAATATWPSSSRSSCGSPPSSWSASPPPGCRTTSRSSPACIEEGQREGSLRADLPGQGGDQGLLRRARRDGHVVDPGTERLRSGPAGGPRRGPLPARRRRSGKPAASRPALPAVAASRRGGR